MNAAQFQDDFVLSLLNHKRGGYFLDVGSAHASHCNNTYYLENFDWNGICIEFDSKYNSSYSGRKCKYLNEDATKISYSNLLIENNFPKEIEYLSLDIDELSYNVLQILPFNEYKFKVITIEHDFYLHGGLYRDKQREILLKNGYMLLCEDVLVEQSGSNPPKTTVEPFEDWWIKREFFTNELVERIKCKKEYPSDIIKKFK